MQRVFDKYDIVRRLAYGGMGEVFLARQTGEARFDRLVILKSLRPELASDPEVVEEFLEEARLAATLNHPNIVSIYEVGKSQGTYFIAMEYIRGEDLFRLCQDCIAQQRWIPLRVALHVVRDAALGLDAAHTASTPQGASLRIVHRDVTPRNLMVRTDGVTKVVDFGVAKAVDRASRTITGGLKGTIAYMSPEQALAEQVDPRSDQFSLGVVLWELLTQKRLFGGRDSIEVLERVRKHDIEPPSAHNDAVNAGLDDVVMRMLERDRERRFPSCRVAADALGKHLGDMAGPTGAERVAAFVQSVAGDVIDARTADLTPSGIGLPPTEPPRAADAPEARRGRPRPVTWVGGGLTVALALGVGVFLGTRDGGGDVEDPLAVELSSKIAAPSTGSGAPAEPSLGDEPPLEGAAAPVELPPAGADGPDGAAGAGPSADLVVEEEAPASAAGSPRAPAPARRDDEPRAPPRVADATGARSAGRSAGTRRDEPRAEAKARPVDDPPRVQPSPEPPATPPRLEGKLGLVTVDTDPWTQVTIDGLPRGATPLYRVELSPGPHMVHLVNHKAGVDVWKEIAVESGQELHLDWKLGGTAAP